MKKIRLLLLTLAILGVWISPGIVLAQTYSFLLTQETVDVYWNQDGTASLKYSFTFANNAGASPIDFVDVGLPNNDIQSALRTTTADIDGKPINDISKSNYVDNAIALGLGSNAIPPNATGTVNVTIGSIHRVLYLDDKDSNYASAVFVPTWFDSGIVKGTTNLTVRFHLPPGVQPEEPRYHPPLSWPGAAEPQTSLDEEGRVLYTWQSDKANGHSQYTFGASFPKKYVPAETITRKPGFFEQVITFIAEYWLPIACISFFLILTIGLPIWSAIQSRKRKMQYLPPKISIEGNGIKRGLTAVEAAVLMEQPLDKIMTMILFSVVKKGAAVVKSRDPLEISVIQPISDGLESYEKEFVKVFESAMSNRSAGLKETMVNLVNSLSEKMKGFSRKETMAYYQEIINKAWSQVETAGTPEVKSKAYEEVMDWTMVDHDYGDRTRRTFGSGPVFVPVWWGHYDPSYSSHVPSTPVSTSQPSSAAAPTMPHLPGSDFSASVVNGVQSFSAGVIGDIKSFTSSITDRTNPLPKPAPVSTSSRGGGGGGHSCACACACAGCACACAGGGR